jgi:type VI secretion system secreted protein Hcp
MAVDAFLKISTPDVKGESKDDVHKDEIEVLSFSWGASRAGSFGAGGGGGVGKTDPQDLSIMKRTDKASALLYMHMCNGQHYGELVLSARRVGGDAKVNFLKITLTDALVTSMQLSGSSEDPMESVSFNYATCKYTYVEQQKDGSGLPEVEHGWNFSENIKL